jgi:transposase
MTEFKRLLTEPGETRRGAVKAVAKRFNLAPKAVYAAIERAKKTGSA